jgi:hypothetical protein
MVLAGVSLGRYPHVCAFFEDRDEEFTCFLPFMREGIEAGERAFHIVDPALRDDHLERPRGAGIATDETQRTGQLEVRSWDEAYLRGGRFDQEATLSLIREILDRARAEGYPRTRLIARAEWALQGLDSSAIVAYEALLNGQLQGYDDPINLHLRHHKVYRPDRPRRSAHASGGRHRGRPRRKPLLRASCGVPGRAAFAATPTPAALIRRPRGSTRRAGRSFRDALNEA